MLSCTSRVSGRQASVGTVAIASEDSTDTIEEGVGSPLEVADWDRCTVAAFSFF